MLGTNEFSGASNASLRHMRVKSIRFDESGNVLLLKCLLACNAQVAAHRKSHSQVTEVHWVFLNATSRLSLVGMGTLTWKTLYASLEFLPIKALMMARVLLRLGFPKRRRRVLWCSTSSPSEYMMLCTGDVQRIGSKRKQKQGCRWLGERKKAYYWVHQRRKTGGTKDGSCILCRSGRRRNVDPMTNKPRWCALV